MSNAPLDCTLCGACCFGRREFYIEILPQDAGRALRPEVLNTSPDGRRFMKMCGGRCAQLTRASGPALVCAVYEDRPEACRAFRAGSFECGMARKHNGALAFAMLTETLVPPESAQVPHPTVAAAVVETGGDTVSAPTIVT